MNQLINFGAAVVLFGCFLAAPQIGLAHGDVTPQPMNTKGLKPLGKTWLKENPYRGNALAAKIGESGYTQNCARCHGIEAVSGGFAPDLRHMAPGAEGDEYYIQVCREGVTRNGAVYMPKFQGILSQEGLWAIRTWLDTKHTDQ